MELPTVETEWPAFSRLNGTGEPRLFTQFPRRCVMEKLTICVFVEFDPSKSDKASVEEMVRESLRFMKGPAVTLDSVAAPDWAQDDE